MPENASKTSENLGKNGDQHLQKNAWRPFCRGHTKKDLRDLCGRKFAGESRTKKSFWTSLGKFGQIYFAPQKYFPAPISRTSESGKESLDPWILKFDIFLLTF